MEDNLPSRGVSVGGKGEEERDTERMEQILQLERISGMRSNSSHSSQVRAAYTFLQCRCWQSLSFICPFPFLSVPERQRPPPYVFF